MIEPQAQSTETTIGRRYWYVGPDEGLQNRRCIYVSHVTDQGYLLVMFRGRHYAIVHRAWLRCSHPVQRGKQARAYPANWPEIATVIKAAAKWRCEHCGHPDDLETGHVLTVHHLDGDPANNHYNNLVALCQRCHLHWQARFQPGQSYMSFIRPEWMARRGLGGSRGQT